jgi:hypothetical protein
MAIEAAGKGTLMGSVCRRVRARGLQCGSWAAIQKLSRLEL